MTHNANRDGGEVMGNRLIEFTSSKRSQRPASDFCYARLPFEYAMQPFLFRFRPRLGLDNLVFFLARIVKNCTESFACGEHQIERSETQGNRPISYLSWSESVQSSILL